MKYCLKKKEKFVTIKCGNGVQLAYSKKYTPAAVISFLQLRNYHVADCILHQKMTNIELWGSLEEGHPKKASYKLIHPDFIEWWRKVQKSGGAEPAIPPIFYEGVKPVALKSEPKGKNSDVEDLEIMVEEPVELAESDEFTFDDGAGISSANITGKNSMVNKCNNVGVVAKSSGYRRDNVRPDRPSQLVRLRTGGENNSVPAHLGMKSSPDVSEECKKKSVNVQTVIGAANFADAGEPIGMSDSIELVANKEVSGDDLRSDYINVDEVLESLYNIDERIELQEKSVYNRSIIVSKAICDCIHFEALIGITDNESKLKMQDLRSKLEKKRAMLKTEYSKLETLKMRMAGEKVEKIYDQLVERGYKPRLLEDMFMTGQIMDYETLEKKYSL